MHVPLHNVQLELAVEHTKALLVTYARGFAFTKWPESVYSYQGQKTSERLKKGRPCLKTTIVRGENKHTQKKIRNKKKISRLQLESRDTVYYTHTGGNWALNRDRNDRYRSLLFQPEIPRQMVVPVLAVYFRRPSLDAPNIKLYFPMPKAQDRARMCRIPLLYAYIDIGAQGETTVVSSYTLRSFLFQLHLFLTLCVLIFSSLLSLSFFFLFRARLVLVYSSLFAGSEILKRITFRCFWK